MEVVTGDKKRCREPSGEAGAGDPSRAPSLPALSPQDCRCLSLSGFPTDQDLVGLVSVVPGHMGAQALPWGSSLAAKNSSPHHCLHWPQTCGPGQGGTWRELRPTAAKAQAGLRCTRMPTSQVRPRTGSRTSTGFTVALWRVGRDGGAGQPESPTGVQEGGVWVVPGRVQAADQGPHTVPGQAGLGQPDLCHTPVPFPDTQRRHGRAPNPQPFLIFYFGNGPSRSLHKPHVGASRPHAPYFIWPPSPGLTTSGCQAAAAGQAAGPACERDGGRWTR